MTRHSRRSSIGAAMAVIAGCIACSGERAPDSSRPDTVAATDAAGAIDTAATETAATPPG